jgi:alpha-L-fucosidase
MTLFRRLPLGALVAAPLVACVFDSAVAFAQQAPAPYVPAPENLAAREAFRDDQFGVFIHWGVYSVLGRGEWVMNNERIPVAKYEPLAAEFNPDKYDADQWVRLFKRAGARYVTITSKHHDGFCMWGTKQTDWNILDRTPYKKDVLKALAEACRRHGLKLFFYHSQLDWHHPDYYPRGRTGQATGRPESGDFDKYIDYMNAQLTELLGGDYGNVAGIWFDGWWDQQTKGFEETKDAEPRATRVEWRLRETYDLIHRLQPACLVGANHHVAPFEGEDFQMFERDLPGENTAGFNPDSKIGQLPLETCDTLNGSWGYNAGDANFKSVKQCVHYLVKAAGRDANLLLNIGPKPDGTIDSESTERLEGIGQWLAVYEPTVRPTRGGPVPPQSWGASTQSTSAIYLHILDPTVAASDAPADGTPSEKAPARTVPADGWLPLAGTHDVPDDHLKWFGEGGPVEHRRNAAGDLEVRRAWDAEAIDTVIVIPKAF